MPTTTVKLWFKTAHQAAQFDLRGRQNGGNGFNPKLRAIILEMAYYANRYLNKEIVVTDILRELTEATKQSPHPYGNGCDVRVHNFTEEERIVIRDHINDHCPYSHPIKRWLKTCLIHGKGRNKHFHLQVR
jgi:hypothetical protein